jgi:hypothetical protein
LGREDSSHGKGRFIAEPGSEPEFFLADLAKVLEAKKTPTRTLRVAALPFEYVILGEKQSRSKDGSFNDSPSGDWTVMKLFFGDDQREVYLNFSPARNKAEFSIKDEDYGDFVVSELAKVLELCQLLTARPFPLPRAGLHLSVRFRDLMNRALGALRHYEVFSPSAFASFA